jgi:hypothetical protein
MIHGSIITILIMMKMLLATIQLHLHPLLFLKLVIEPSDYYIILYYFI